MTKADIVDRICEQVGGFSKKDAADVVDLVFNAMKDALAEGDKIKISGFGNFVVRDKGPRPGRNPQTGDEIMIDAHKALTFRPSNILRATLNER
ncbi:MAG: integration host factor subunit alpha [Nannocystaceae bacterium]